MNYLMNISDRKLGYIFHTVNLGLGLAAILSLWFSESYPWMLAGLFIGIHVPSCIGLLYIQHKRREKNRRALGDYLNEVWNQEKFRMYEESLKAEKIHGEGSINEQEWEKIWKSRVGDKKKGLFIVKGGKE